MNTVVAGSCDPKFEPVREAFLENLDGADLGAGVSVWLDGRQVVNLWGGYRDEARKRRWTEDTLVMVASVTKAFSAVCLLQLIEQGKVELEAPVATYWPEFAKAGKSKITIRHILTHQGGLPAISAPYTYEDYFAWDPITKLLEDQEPFWVPGEKHGYHPVLFGNLVGEVVRRVAKVSIGQYLQAHVCRPLGLDFFIGVPKSEFDRVAEVSFATPDVMSATPEFKALMERAAQPGSVAQLAFGNPPPPPDIAKADGLKSAEMPGSNGHGTAPALAKFFAALSQGGELDGVRILEPETVARATEEEVFGIDATIGATSRFGLGFMLRHDIYPIGPNPKAFGHPGAGGNLGFADPAHKLGFGYVMNRGKPSMFGSPTAYNLVNALYSCL